MDAMRYTVKLRRLRAWCDTRKIGFVEVAFEPLGDDRYTVSIRTGGYDNRIVSRLRGRVAAWRFGLLLWLNADGTHDMGYMIDTARGILVKQAALRQE